KDSNTCPALLPVTCGSPNAILQRILLKRESFLPPKNSKTYNSRDSPMVTHLTTSPPVSCLCKAERTGSPIFMILWSYVLDLCSNSIYIE
ncbi:hypothetical protein K505DRAFT_401120, partial [Melanomma pulvis-pyrius CBS 109.77]